MPLVDLTTEEWSRVLQVISTKCTWVEANALLMRITAQLNPPAATPLPEFDPSKQQTNSGMREVPVESAQHDPPRRGHRT